MRSKLWGVWAASVLVTTSHLAFAADASAEDVASARVLGTAGIDAAEKGDCAVAIPKLAAAEKLYHAPTTASWLGQCLIDRGQLVAGTETLERLLHEPLAPSAPPVFVQARHRAEGALVKALPRIAKLRLHVAGPSSEAVRVEVDGLPVLQALFDEGRPTDPGPHNVRAYAEGFLAQEASVTLGEGESKQVSLSLAAAPPPPKPQVVLPPAPEPNDHPAPAPEMSHHGSIVPAVVSFSIGAAGLAVGAVFGAMALGTHDTLARDCGPAKTSCLAGDQSKISDMSTQAWVANAGFGVGIVGAAVGTVLLLTNGHSSTSSSQTGRVQVTPYATNSSIGLMGAF